jgi:ribonucleoside-diphosphate reductase alpha chain
MLTCKFGNWWETNPQRGRANNSAVLVRHRVTKEFFLDLWKKIELSNAGEPGIYFTNNPDWGTNPCCEIALRPYQFCNLCEVNVSNVESQEDLNNRVAVAAFFGTLQAGFTDFHYLRPIWKKTTEKDALIGVGMTGIASMEVFKYDLTEAANEAELTNIEIAQTLGINRAARITCVKPSGTTSCVLGTASGIHAWHNDFYIRRMQMSKSEDLYKYLNQNHPSLVKDHLLIPNSAVVEIPIKAPAGSVLRTESALDTLERVKKVSQEWIKPGHIHGDNTHNVSATISIDKNRMYPYHVEMGEVWECDEWQEVGEWMWENKQYYNGLSVLPFDGGSYSQAPFEDITEEQYNNLVGYLTSIDLTQVIEEDDLTDLSAELACSGPMGCEVK